MFHLSALLAKTAIYSWLPELPIEPFTWIPFIMMGAISLVMILPGDYGYGHQDIEES